MSRKIFSLRQKFTEDQVCYRISQPGGTQINRNFFAFQMELILKRDRRFQHSRHTIYLQLREQKREPRANQQTCKTFHHFFRKSRCKQLQAKLTNLDIGFPSCEKSYKWPDCKIWSMSQGDFCLLSSLERSQRVFWNFSEKEWHKESRLKIFWARKKITLFSVKNIFSPRYAKHFPPLIFLLCIKSKNKTVS